METVKRLISLDEAMKATHHEIYWTESQQAAVRSFLVKQTKVDAVEVVRCKDCKYCRVASWGERLCARKQTDGVYAELSNLREDDFCSYGERREGVYGNT